MALGDPGATLSEKLESNEGSEDEDNETISENSKQNESDQSDEYDEIKHHSSYVQVMLDVNRCAGRLQHLRQVYFHRTDDDEPPDDLTSEFENNSDQNRPSNQPLEDVSDRPPTPLILESQRKLQQKLARLIVRLLIQNPDLHYYQGFHDVCLTFMTLLGEERAESRLNCLIESHFKIFMQPTMDETQDFLALIPIIIGLHDPIILQVLEKSEVGTIFALSWVITWFSHVIPAESDVKLIFNFLENRDPHMVLYLCSEIVIYSKSRLIELEPEMSTVHHFLCQLPRKENLPLADLLEKATKAYQRWSPEFIKQKLERQKRARSRLVNYNPFSTFTDSLSPMLSTIVASNTRTAFLVLVVASAIALQFDRWIR